VKVVNSQIGIDMLHTDKSTAAKARINTEVVVFFIYLENITIVRMLPRIPNMQRGMYTARLAHIHPDSDRFVKSIPFVS